MNQLSIDFTAAPAARVSDPITSYEAARDAKVHASHARMLVLKYLAAYPLTDFQLADYTGWQQTSIGKRRGECVTAGWVTVNTDPHGNKVKRETPSGSMALTWRITETGVAMLKGLQ